MRDSIHQELLQQAMTGDRDALHVLLTLIYPDIKKWVASVWSIQNDPQYGVEDLVQDTVASAWQSFDSFETAAFQAFKKWMIEIARNHIRNAVRSLNAQKRKHTQQDVGEDGQLLVEFFARHTKSPRSFLADKEMVALLLATIDALPQAQRDIIRWRLIHGDSFCRDSCTRWEDA